MSKIHGYTIKSATVHLRNNVPFRWVIITNGVKLLFENNNKSPIWGDELPASIQRFCTERLVSSSHVIEHEEIPLLNAPAWIETVATYK